MSIWRFQPTRLVTIAVIATCTAPAMAGYDVSDFIKPTDGYTHISQAAINNQGTIVFVSDDPTHSGQGMFSGPSPSTDRLPIGFISVVPGAVIGLNDLNSVSFFGSLNGKSGIYSVPVSAPAPSAVKITTDPRFVMEGDVSFGSTSINNAGTVVFHAQIGSAPPDIHVGLFVGPDPVNDALALAPDDLPDVEHTPRINNAGTVVFGGRDRQQLPAVFTRSKGGPITEVAHMTSFTQPNPHFVSFDSWDINDSGRVAFLARLDDSRGIFTGPDPAADAFVTTTRSTSVGAPTGYLDITSFTMNNEGTIVFCGSPNTSGPQRFGLYKGPDPVADKIMDLDQRVFLIPNSLNDNGDLVFAYSGFQGQSGVTEVHGVPEPNCLLPLGAAALALRRWQTRPR